MSDQSPGDESLDQERSSVPDSEGSSSGAATQPSSSSASVPASAGAADPEDWQSTAASGDDERYLSERPPHWE